MLKEEYDDIAPPPQHEPHDRSSRRQDGKAADRRRHPRDSRSERRSGRPERGPDQEHTTVGMPHAT